MSIINHIPDNSRVRYPVARFVSSNLDGFGRYVWENAGNTKVTLMTDLNANHVYLVERVSFYANVAEADWLESMITPVDFPRIPIAFNRVGGASIYAEPFRAVNYVDNNEQLLYFQALQPEDILVASMFGQVQQTAGMVGKLNLIAQINFTMYEITDRKWIEAYKRDPGHVQSGRVL